MIGVSVTVVQLVTYRRLFLSHVLKIPRREMVARSNLRTGEALYFRVLAWDLRHVRSCGRMWVHAF